MTLPETFVQVIRDAGDAGVEMGVLVEKFGSRERVHCIAHAAKLRGCHFKSRHHRYFYLRENKSFRSKALAPAKSRSAEVKVNGKICLGDVHVSQATIARMDARSRQDVVEQLRRVYLHGEIAKAIVRSYEVIAEVEQRFTDANLLANVGGPYESKD